MKAILLAAGRGTRISRMVEEVPKSTLPINGVPLIRHTVEMLLSYGISCVVCVGYQKEKIYAALDGLEVEYCVNPFYNVTNSIASIWFAQNHIEDDMIILNADVYFSHEILQSLLADRRDVVMMIDRSRTEVGDYFFSVTDNGCITKYGKELPISERACEYVGIAKVAKDFCEDFNRRLNELIYSYQHELWWENVLYSFAKERDIYTLDVEGEFWSEIDYFDDYERILKYLEKKNAK